MRRSLVAADLAYLAAFVRACGPRFRLSDVAGRHDRTEWPGPRDRVRRMVAGGWLRPDRVAGAAWYELTPFGAAQLGRAGPGVPNEPREEVFP